MDKVELKGNAETQKLARWMATLLMQRGFSFGIESEIVLGQEELADYLLSQGVGQERAAMIDWIERAAAENTHLFSRRDSDRGVEYVTPKRKLVELFQPAAPAPAARGAAATKPAVAPGAKEKSAAPEPAETAQAAGEPPVTQQYQLAILQALYRLGGAGKAADVVEMIPLLMTLPKEHLGTYARGTEGKSEQPKYVKFVQSARGFLVQQGELQSPNRGIWELTPAGKERLRQAGLAK